MGDVNVALAGSINITEGELKLSDADLSRTLQSNDAVDIGIHSSVGEDILVGPFFQYATSSKSGQVDLTLHFGVSGLWSRQAELQENPEHVAWSEANQQFLDDQIEMERRQQAAQELAELNAQRQAAGLKPLPLDPENDPSQFNPAPNPGTEPEPFLEGSGKRAFAGYQVASRATVDWHVSKFFDIQPEAVLSADIIEGAATVVFQGNLNAVVPINESGFAFVAGINKTIDLTNNIQDPLAFSLGATLDFQIKDKK